ncbi:O-methyltransferase [Flavobacterium agrisoli]|uniref:Class I SAM-dependent methyltransferase n=1 Tax=Flavobacterium agrisoli TaxID=2793066 RepID=A0A934UK07_9FLAO|nr:class I SAM-dependent methyltransferase [Flavobacterium agrisoli]MBK0370068.1 class I SAM-dependent methyltransferase [Flavobacterium agrisoli]
MFFQIRAYLHFLWHSKNEHSVHSPFVFLLLTRCWYDKKAKPEYQILQEIRNSVLQNKTHITITDFGAGSKVFKSNTRSVAAIAKNAGISVKRAQLLFRIVRFYQPKTILELGTSLGLATSAMALANSSCKVTTLEGCPETSQIAQNLFDTFQLQNISLHNTAFETYLNQLPLDSKIDMIYFDGNHSEKATLLYFEKLLSTATNDSVWIFDDIHWSAEMESAWEQIKNHPKVTVTIDSFQWGFVFFRREQSKQHFILRT